MQNIINIPHIVTGFIHERYKIFLGMLINEFKVKDFWSCYEWQHKGTSYIHDFI